MSSAMRRLSKEEMLERAAKRWKKVVESDSEPQSPPASSKPPRGQSKKEVPAINVEDHQITLPADFLSCEGVGKEVWPAADSLLLPAVYHRLQTLPQEDILKQGVEHALQALQHLLTIKAQTDLASNELKKKAELYEKEAEELRHKLVMVEKDKGKVQEELKVAAGELESGKAEVAELRKRVEELLEELLDLESISEVRGRAKMAWELYSSKGDFAAVKEVAKKEVDCYLENVGNMANLLATPDADTQATTSTTDLVKKGDAAVVVEATMENLEDGPLPLQSN